MRSNSIISSLLPVAALLCCTVALTSGCRRDARSGGDGRLPLAVSIEPQAFLVERIGGDRVRVETLVPAGKEPEYYQATPEKIAILARSKALFRTGMPFEEALLPKLRSLAAGLEIVDLREGIVLRELELHSHGDAGATRHGTGHAHHVGCSHDGLDPHVWFAPSPLKTQAETVLNTLLRIDPDGAETYRSGYENFLNELKTTRDVLADKLVASRGRTVFVFHPAYGYFCDEFGLRQRAIEFEGRAPGPQQIAALIAETRRSERRPTIFVQPEFNRAPAEAIAEATGARIVVHSSLQRDVLESMIRFADAIAGASPEDGALGQ